MLGQEVSLGSLLIGITGNSGCGQTTAAEFLADHATVCFLDELGHRLLGKEYVRKELASAFGNPEIVSMSGEEVRKYLSNLVFDNPKLMERLNVVVHPRMARWVRNAAAALRKREGIWILEGALLFELALGDVFDETVLIRDSLERCAERLVLRDGINEEDAKKRWNFQLALEEKASMAGTVVDNNGDLEYLKRKIVGIFQEISKRHLD